MIPSEFDTIAKLEADLWSAADNLRANSKLTSLKYFMAVLGDFTKTISSITDQLRNLSFQKLRTARDLPLPKLMSGEIEV